MPMKDPINWKKPNVNPQLIARIKRLVKLGRYNSVPTFIDHALRNALAAEPVETAEEVLQ